MRGFLFIFSLCMLAYGLWVHDWTTIIAALALAIAWPLMVKDVHDNYDEKLVAQWWNDAADPERSRWDDNLEDSA